MTKNQLMDHPPADAELTAYDRLHFKMYLRLLDADAEGADWMEVAEVLLHLDPKHNPDRAHRVYASHLARAKWISEHGYSNLMRAGLH